MLEPPRTLLLPGLLLLAPGAPAPEQTDPLPGLVKQLEDGDSDPARRVAAARALGALGKEAQPPVPALLGVLAVPRQPGVVGRQPAEDPLWEIALGEIGPAALGAVPLLDWFVEAPWGDYRYWQVYALWRMQGRTEQCVAALGEILHDRSRFGMTSASEETAVAAEVLGKLGPAAKAAVPDLIDACRCALPNTRREAIRRRRRRRASGRARGTRQHHGPRECFPRPVLLFRPRAQRP
jgi:hypothetical protein